MSCRLPMDQSDSKSCEIVDDVKHLNSSETLDFLGKGMIITCVESGSSNAVLEKEAHKSDQEINSFVGKTYLETKCPNYCLGSVGDCRNKHNPTNCSQSYADPTSVNLVVEGEIHQKENCAEGTCGVTSCRNGFVSLTAGDKVSSGENPKDGEISIHSIEKIDSSSLISVNSDVSSRTGQPINGEERKLDVGRTKGSWLNAGRDALHPVMHTTFHEAQFKTESSSNSTNCMHPVSSSMDSCQEMAAGAKSSMHGRSGTADFCTSFNCSMAEPSARRVVLKIAAHITQKKVCCVGATDSKPELGMIADQNSMIVEKVDVPKPCLQKEKSAAFLVQNKEQLCYKLDDGWDLAEKVAREVEQKVGSYREPSGNYSSIDENLLGSRFNLNNYIQENEVVYPEQSVDDNASSCTVINVSVPVPVVAKCGIPACIPMTPLKFEGEKGWRGSAATSAFRPASHCRSSNRNNESFVDNNNCSLKDCQVVTGIDLNVAATGDDSGVELLPKPCVWKPSDYHFKESTVEVSSKGADRLNIDLNCLAENEDSREYSPPVSLSRHSVVDFDLNYKPSLGEGCISAHQPDQDVQPLRSKAMDVPAIAFMRNSGQQYYSARPVHGEDLSSMLGFNHGHAQPFLVATPNVFPPVEQMQMVPPQIYPYNNGFCVGPKDQLSPTATSAAVLPYVKDACGMIRTTVFPQILGTHTLPTFFGAPHLMEVVGGPSPTDIRYIRPTRVPETGSREENGGIFLFPFKNLLGEEQMKSAQHVSVTSMKRREPEGGWDSLQLGNRQLIVSPSAAGRML